MQTAVVSRSGEPSRSAGKAEIAVGLLTGGDDKSYALGLTESLVARGVSVDFIGSDKLDDPELHNTPRIRFLNLRGDQRENVPMSRKALRVLTYYVRLLKYAATAQPRIFHILWNNKFEWFDRTILMLYYRMLGRRIAFTAHNVNAAERDGRDGMLNRLSLKIQYRLANHIFVHTERMRADLMGQFGVGSSKISVIPFGINNTFPRTDLTMVEAKRRLGLEIGDRAVLFFGQIAPYKGLECLVTAMSDLIPRHGEYRLVIAGKVKRGHADYWERVERKLIESGIRHRVIERVEHIPDEEVELYFKAADVVAIPYMQIFQSGVPFLAYSFGLPIIATDVGSLRHDVMEGKTGFICRPGDPASLAQTLESYFCSELYRNLEGTRQVIKAFANERYSWTRVGEITEAVYTELLAPR